MRESQNKVKQFKLAMDQGEHIGTSPAIPGEATRRLAAKLILEESVETLYALGFHVVELEKDEKRYLDIMPHDEPLELKEIAKELQDLKFVSLWADDCAGLDAESLFDAVAENNLTKVGGPKCKETGKQLKPAGYKKVDLEPLIASQMGESA